jgi:hypothetical protein
LAGSEATTGSQTSGADAPAFDKARGSFVIVRSRIQGMKIGYFTDTDTLYVEFRDRPVADSRQ